MYIVARERKRKEGVRERDNKIPIACCSNESQGMECKRGEKEERQSAEKARFVGTWRETLLPLASTQKKALNFNKLEEPQNVV